MKRIVVIFLVTLLLIPAPAMANDSLKISNLEKRVKVLELELSRLKKQEERASKYLKCVQKVEGNAITVPFKILNCIRK
jgi:ABC-type phosphate transport system auxiliary subunit